MYIKLINEYNADKLYKHYQEVDKKAFDIITKEPKKTIYIQWLLDLYKNHKFKLEDIEKANKYLSIFNNPNVYKKLGGINKINKLKSIQELFELIEPYYKVENINSNDKDEFIENKCFVKEFKNYKLYIPNTYEESRYLGRGTQWCTAADSKDGEETFHQYTKNENEQLLVLINKSNNKIKYQIHFETVQFTDAKDNTATDTFDYVNNTDIIDYFMTNYFDLEVYNGDSDDNYDNYDNYYVSDKLFQIFNVAYIYQYYSEDHYMFHYFDHYDESEVTRTRNIDPIDYDNNDELYKGILNIFNYIEDEIDLDTKVVDTEYDFMLQYRNRIFVNSNFGNYIPKYDNYEYMNFNNNTTIKEMIDFVYNI